MTESVTVSIRIPGDVHGALADYARQQGINVTDAANEAISVFVGSKDTTDMAVRKRLASEAKLIAEVMAYAADVKDTNFETDVTRTLFKWIDANHRDCYSEAIGTDGSHVNRINPQLARRFAYAIGGGPVLNDDGKATKGYVQRNANELIQSYTLLKKA